ncbi:hypothetical protein P691DRAFT_694145 [Macrolepiota fuliginosa MF-IS2]|uniref:BHLH domain-containing protein n=1 Tax=Macrolepiota fuliginosa MF-IS2 TaxID=1400762 RepID=A0A9P6C9E2_9AGAR|nr:hypothetical protein P691DRAFT_694145 [Macrolepiota fuliginosa MF-IS2]
MPSPAPSSADFEFTSFNPSLSALFPHPQPLPSSAELFSSAETNDILGFLDNFTDLSWEFNPYPDHPPSLAPYSNPHLNTTPEPSTSTRPKPTTRTGSSRGTHHSSTLPPEDHLDFTDPNQPHSTTSGSPVIPSDALRQNGGTSSAASRAKPLLSTPQKRLNHIMSEQKRRNAIRDGYAQLITLLAPSGSAPTLSMPTRGRPKGSGSRGKGRSKGKSGVLFRAVEYCRWLEEGRDALREEVIRLEAAAGIHS